MVGAGGHATNAIYPSLRHSRLALQAVADLDKGRAERAARLFGALRTYGDHREMLVAEDLDAVGVVGPPAMHHEIGLEVLRAGKHLFIEKPPGRSLEQARELQAAARDAGVQCMVGFMKRFARAYRRTAEIIASPDFGTPRVLKLNYSHWRQPAGLREHAIFMSVHPLDLCRFFLGDVAGGSVYKRRVGDDHVVTLMLEHASGAVSQIALSAFEPRVQEHVEISGDNTLVQVWNLMEIRYLRSAPGFADALGTDETMAGLWYPELTIPIPENESFVLQGYAGELAAFARALEEGRPVPSSIDDGVEAMRLAEAVISAPEGMSTLVLPA